MFLTGNALNNGQYRSGEPQHQLWWSLYRSWLWLLYNSRGTGQRKIEGIAIFSFFFFLLLPLPISILKRAKYSKMPGGLPNSPLAQLIAVPLGSATWYKVTNDFFFKSRLNFPSFFCPETKKKEKRLLKFNLNYQLACQSWIMHQLPGFIMIS